MQTSSTNICERMGRSQELSEFNHGTVIGCHLRNKSIRQIPATKYSTVNCYWYYHQVQCKASDVVV
ncbi:unnamed protein product [Staurois parvus]|uniref:Uncharacterized protein n=1 Tax=Staurois parvus TaxID=386267 RepID=A0ABN9BH93_9NEOB|nr:unnamed protein product [Staurois parvus]